MRNRSKAIAAAAMALMLALGAGCSINTKDNQTSGVNVQDNVQTAADNNSSAETEAQKNADAPKDESSEGTSETKSDNEASVTLNGSSVSLSQGAQGIAVDGCVVTISAAGSYTVSGTLDDGQIIVNAPKTDKVDIYLDNVTMTCSSSAPIRVEQADRVTLHLADGSVNTFADTAANTVSACISSKEDLTIKGKGTLKVTGSAKHAIKSSNDLKIKNGILELSAVSAGLYGEDSVQLTGGTITVTACKDGIKSSNKEKTDKGWVSSEDAVVDIQNASGNGIEAVTGVTVLSGSIKIHSLKQAINCTTQSITEGCVVKY